MSVTITGHDLRRTLIQVAIWTVPALVLMPLLFLVAPATFFHDVDTYLGAHSIMELFACGVSLLIFGMGWHASREEHSARMAILSAGFLAVALLDLVHLLSYQGMPPLVTPASPEKAIDFWLAARYAQAVTLCAGCLYRSRIRVDWYTRSCLMLFALSYVGLACWIGLFHQEWLPTTFVPGQGLTKAKIWLEVGVIAINAATMIGLLNRRTSGPELPLHHMLSALLLLLICEVLVSLYHEVHDNLNFFAHIYKVLGFTLIYRAIFVTGVAEPYRRLAASERNYRLLVDQAGIAILQTEPGGRIVFANELAAQLIGFSHTLPRAMDLAEVFADRNAITAMGRLAPPEVIETHVIRPDGSRVLVEITHSRLGDGGDILLLRDIDAARRADAELRIRDIAFASSITAFVIANLDGTVRYANKSAADLWGYASTGHMLGVAISSFHAEPDHAAAIIAGLKQNGQWNGELRCRRKDGTVFDVRGATNLVRDAAGHPLCMIGSFIDLTELNRLDAERRLWADAFENAVVGIGVTHAATSRQISVNPAYAAMHGTTVADLVDCPVIDLYDPDELATHSTAIRTADTQGHTEFDTIRRRANGERFPARIWLRSIFDAAGQPLYRIATVIDMTERLALEQRLQQAQKMEAIGNLTGGIAHDFNNLLGVVILSLDTLLPHLKNDPEPELLANEALTAALSGATLVKQLLAFARRQDLSPVRLSVNDVVQEIATLAGRTLGETITVSVEPGQDVWPVSADRGQLEAGLLNLALNARDAMPGGGELTIRTGNAHVDSAMVQAHPDLAEGDYVTITVSDTGIGMSADVKARIFEPFFTTKAPGHGTGLGLSSLFGFLRQSKGLVTVDSAAGHGTAFRLYLPRATPEPTPRPPAVAGAAPRTRHGETILVVEDNAMFRDAVAHQLRALGYRVVTAADASSALESIAGQDIDLVLGDVVMAGNMDGIGLAREIKTHWPALPIILMSGYTEQRINGLGSGLPATVRFLRKPFRSEDLADALRATLAGR